MGIDESRIDAVAAAIHRLVRSPSLQQGLCGPHVHDPAVMDCHGPGDLEGRVHGIEFHVSQDEIDLGGVHGIRSRSNV
jgi:hypothetical protein